MHICTQQHPCQEDASRALPEAAGSSARMAARWGAAFRGEDAEMISCHVRAQADLTVSFQVLQLARVSREAVQSSARDLLSGQETQDLTEISGPSGPVSSYRSGWEPCSLVPLLIWNSPWTPFLPDRK